MLWSPFCHTSFAYVSMAFFVGSIHIVGHSHRTKIFEFRCVASPGWNLWKEAIQTGCPHLPRAVRVKNPIIREDFDKPTAWFSLDLSRSPIVTVTGFLPSKSAPSFINWYLRIATIRVERTFRMGPRSPHVSLLYLINVVSCDWQSGFRHSRSQNNSRNRALWYTTMHYGLMSFHKISEESEDGRWCSTVFTCALPSCESPQKTPLCPAARIGFVPEPFSQKFAWIFAAGFKSMGCCDFPRRSMKHGPKDQWYISF